MAGGVSMCTFMQQNYRTYNSKSRASCVGNDAVSNTVDNTTIYFDQPNWNSPTPETVAGKIVMLIDVNGWQKKPNSLGHDLFMFQVTDKGQLLPMGTENSVFPSKNHCSTSSTASTNGYGCISRALLEKDFFKNLPK